jgi:hypothetical protein
MTEELFGYCDKAPFPRTAKRQNSSTKPCLQTVTTDADFA